eukprot:TRINITY_DN9992_c0_g1_i2.p1 TRINITY_DN9992_c0_g1~~TRINITY_DN9992_c0_g1_i2.p1  ORF type:complete len:115 (-),score=1.05 TRINITY_DN9992_c0_g1_i2:115-459(-)
MQISNDNHHHHFHQYNQLRLISLSPFVNARGHLINNLKKPINNLQDWRLNMYLVLRQDIGYSRKGFLVFFFQTISGKSRIYVKKIEISLCSVDLVKKNVYNLLLNLLGFVLFNL